MMLLHSVKLLVVLHINFIDYSADFVLSNTQKLLIISYIYVLFLRKLGITETYVSTQGLLEICGTKF